MSKNCAIRKNKSICIQVDSDQKATIALGQRRPLLWRFRIVLLFLGTPAFLGMLGACSIFGNEDYTADQLLKDTADVYADCQSYRDTGVVTTRYIEQSDVTIEEKTFSTAFVRPDRFRFEYLHQDDRYIIWRDGSDVRQWSTYSQQIATIDTLALAIAGATGVSSGSAHNVPALLLPDDIPGLKLTEMEDGRRIDNAWLDQDGEPVTEDQADSTECYRIEGQWSDDPMVLWIDRRTLLVRRIEKQTQFDSFRTETTTTYNPEVNSTISDTLLDFGVPSQS